MPGSNPSSYDKSGVYLDAIESAVDPTTLRITTVTVTTASATIQALLVAASTTIHASIKKITLRPAGTVSIALGAAAVAGTNDLASGASYTFACKAATDLRFDATGNTAMLVVQEG